MKKKLELTWIGKENRPRLEPRILLEDQTRSFHATKRVSDQDIFDNRLIFGDNLLALKALEQEFFGKIKCIYIDPPFNTGAAMQHYEDGIEHSIWLNLMYERLRLLRNLLNESGSIFIHLDDNELDYFKIAADEVLGRSNFINRMTIEARSPSAFSTVNPGVFKASEYILWYAKDRSTFRENAVRVQRRPDLAYNKWLDNPDDDYRTWRLIPIRKAYQRLNNLAPSTKVYREQLEAFIIEHAKQVLRLTAISETGAGKATLDVKRQSEKDPEKIFRLDREGLDPQYIVSGQQIAFYSRNVHLVDGVICATSPLTNIWTDIAWEGIANEGGVSFKKGKKPEKLIRRCLQLATSTPADIVLDSFAGSGTTGAVAHKMRRRWILVEMGEHCHTHIIPRLKGVIEGTDGTGITNTVDWKGGGGFRYYRLAPSLLKQDKWGNWVIREEFNAAMLAEAVCKLEGFTYAPSETVYWQHGHSTETDFIYVTTQSLNRMQLDAISEEVGNKRSLLICCSAFRCKPDAYANLTLKKIPQAVMTRCEWGRDDYSLKISNLQMMDPPPEAVGDDGVAAASGKDGKSKKKATRKSDQTELSL